MVSAQGSVSVFHLITAIEKKKKTGQNNGFLPSG